MYANARSRVRVNGQYSEEFDVRVGVHQGSVLSPLLFILVLEALLREFRTGTPWELLYADDLVIMADSLETCSRKLKVWKAAMEMKGLRVNMSKTKFLISGVGLDVLKDSGKFPCAVCRSGVGSNSIQCFRCDMWVHKRCSNLKGRLVQNTQYTCPRCMGIARPIDGRPFSHVDIEGSKLDVVPTFPYLGDLLNSGGGCDSAIAGRCCVAWGKFRKLLPLLTTRHVSPMTRGHIYSSCIRAAMLHGSETWGPNVTELQRLRRNDRAMVRWICGVNAYDETPSDKLLEKLGLNDITTVLRCRRLRWAGHVERAPQDTGISMVRNLTVPGKKGRGRPRKTWEECVKKDILDCGLKTVDPLDRDAWRAAVRRCRVGTTPDTGTRVPL
jgi:hypothetical protein